MKAYLDIVRKIIDNGIYKPNRTGIGAYTVIGEKFEHDMSEGFPILTTREMPFKIIATELEFFIKGITDKKWLQDRKCYIWDEWANPNVLKSKFSIFREGEHTLEETEYNFNLMKLIYDREFVPSFKDVPVPPKASKQLELLLENFVWDGKEYKLDSSKINSDSDASKNVQNAVNLIKDVKLFGTMIERDIGPVYGWQWRHNEADYKGYDKDYAGKGIDQLANIVNTLKRNQNDRRMIATAWHPRDINEMGLPACHYGFQVTVTGDKLNLLWNQRSCDTMLGVPFNITSYALLLHLLAKESNLKEGKLIGFLADVHIYENHIETAKQQLEREPKKLPRIETPNFESIFSWTYRDTKRLDYNPLPKMEFGKVAV